MPRSLSHPALLALALLAFASLLGACDEKSRYRACGGDGDCEGSERCTALSTELEGAPLGGRMCTWSCTHIQDCGGPVGGRATCLALREGEEAHCYATCTRDADCLDGSRCLRFTLATSQVIDACFPDEGS